MTYNTANDSFGAVFGGAGTLGAYFKQPVVGATVSALAANTRTDNVITADANGALGTAIDGLTLEVGDRVLVKNESTGANNGIYAITALGDGSNPFVLTRATDMDADADISGGVYVVVQEGASFADSAFILTNDGSLTLNTTALTFTKFSGLGQVSAGTSMEKTGDTIGIANGGVGATQLASSAVEEAKIANGAVTPTKMDLTQDYVFTGGVAFTGAIKFARTEVDNTAYTVQSGDSYVGVINLSQTRVITLPAAATAGAGTIIMIKDESGNATQSIKITVDGNSSETIDGATTYDIVTAYGAVSLITDGANWYIY